jgi:hypothetical protein
MRLERSGRMALLAAVVTSLALGLPSVAAADDGEREVRRVGTCTGSSRATMRLEADDGRIEVEFEIRTRSTTRAWRVVLLHERRVAFHGLVRPRSGGRSVRLRRTVPDWFGRDTIVVRATGPGVETCRAIATI